ncbi:morphogenetic protein [Klebsiella pneumoniae]|uniref:morphogenetic protein n=1 Tax=Klebsiella pneumoniae TaxID=573 RepID=UPI0034D38CB4
MKERGMIFNGEMVRAILDGRKTQTRRPVKFPVHDKNLGCELAGNELAGELSAGNYLNSAFGKPGDRIWVRETWSDVNLDGAPAVAYRADDEVYDLMENESLLDEDGAFNYQDTRVSKYQFAAWHSDLISGIEGNWRPSIHMPRWASRILLEITNVRVERLNSMHDVDAMREGIQNLTTCSHSDFGIPGVVNAQHPVRAFQLLWESIYGTDSWHANPWVWVIEFKRVEGGAA